MAAALPAKVKAKSIEKQIQSFGILKPRSHPVGINTLTFVKATEFHIHTCPKAAELTHGETFPYLALSLSFFSVLIQKTQTHISVGSGQYIWYKCIKGVSWESLVKECLQLVGSILTLECYATETRCFQILEETRSQIFCVVSPSFEVHV